jgi:hypothetical protein
MTKAQQVAAVLLKPELSRDPAYSGFRELMKEAMTVDRIEGELLDRMYAALPR